MADSSVEATLPVIVKLGGSAMEDAVATAATLDVLAEACRMRRSWVLVHGGGKPIDRAMAAAGLVPKKIAGRRYTDDATLAIVVSVLQELNQQLVKELHARGCPAVAMPTSPAEYPLMGQRLMLPGLDLQPVDLGRVGTVTGVRAHVPYWAVVPSLAVDAEGDGGWLNINADTVASALARTLQAQTVLFLSDMPGLLKDKNEPSTLVAHLTASESREWIASGIIDGGMIPKIEACLEALDSGAERAVLLDGRQPEHLRLALARTEFRGTQIHRT
ncbi:MAG: acetylglutamate kinase [Gemmataceae bacterium]